MFQFLCVAVLCIHHHLPSVICDKLLCHYSAIVEKDRTPLIVPTECPTNKTCCTAYVRYGKYTILKGVGCVEKEKCAKIHDYRQNGVVYTIHYDCCDWQFCNSYSGHQDKLSSPSLSMTLHPTVTVVIFGLLCCFLLCVH